MNFRGEPFVQERGAMPVRINVGPPTLTISHGSTFMVTAKDGGIGTEGEEGLFAADTRFLSYYAITMNGRPWDHVNSSPVTHHIARVYLQNQHVPTDEGDIPPHTLGLALTRTAGSGIHEDIDLTNYGPRRVRATLEVALRSDFADLFEVKARHVVRRAEVETTWHGRRRELRTSYRRGHFSRVCSFRVVRSDAPPHYANGRVTFAVDLEPRRSWHACCHYSLAADREAAAPPRRCAGGRAHLDHRLRRWLDGVTALESSNDDVEHLYLQSVEDVGALRLHEHDLGPEEWVPAAGLPWFATLFGRDCLIAALQSLTLHPGLARGTLRKLEEFQAKQLDDWRDAQPGKILHELRHGELARFHQIPHTPYYGTADATPLYLILLHETWKWTGDDSLLRAHRETALRCLHWIEHYGDLDGDGFQEYRKRSPKGYENQGWKDSGDALVYPDGRRVAAPKGTCELQGYVFDAWLRTAEAFDALGDRERAADLRRRAAALAARFDDRFWCEDIGCYAFALDPQKDPVRSVASNAGHCLWSGIATPEHAARTVRRLLEPDMWTGWGIRTLSARNGAYNPLSYQCGSVWPHDNGIIALGFKRYGFAEASGRLAHDIVDAAAHFVSYRLPELYAGITRGPATFPVEYRRANVPQAWAAGSIFHLLRALLGISADAPNRRLYVDPALPDWLPDVSLRNLRVGKTRVDLRFWREGRRTRWDVLRQTGRIVVEEQPWGPWPIRRRAA
jgi:glycogen debranching enzyme